MIALAVDDERIMLNALTKAISASPDIDEMASFTVCSEALEWASDNTIDIAFLDISMRGIGGLTLAEKILEMQPDCKIIFCTGYAEYAVDAFKIHVSGYLMKPITANAVQREIDYIKGQKTSFSYKTPYGIMDMELYTKDINYTMSMFGGVVVLEYELFAGTGKIENKMEIKILAI